ncbi:MAG TPA: Dyp-type peroxidase [Acidimicrobiales bacterium]|nr:Dyp-type peroxidase [Acidimicrobiales bacterium]
MSAFERHDVQGLVVSGYGTMHQARYLLMRVADAGGARRWLGALADRITASAVPEERRCINLALTHAGLRALGLEPGELGTFSPPFQAGMASGHRRRILSDGGASAPELWDWGGSAPGHDAVPAADVHAVLLVFASDEETMAEVEAAETGALTAGGAWQVVRRLVPEPLPGRLNVGKFGVEHFGFADGMSQPVIRGSGQEEALGGDEARRSVIDTGEFVLGYPNGYGELTPWPRLALPGGGGGDFGRNGSYLVFRQLAQDVAGFWGYLRDAVSAEAARAGASPQPDDMVRLGAKMVGRWPSGAPLVRSWHRDDPDLGTDNAFGYAAVDPQGRRCPLGAHIRRSNPRDALGDDPDEALELANLHRIMRRGRVYGPGLDDPLEDDGKERGLFFLCLNANIERQFEFVQHHWCNNEKFAGLYDEQDPLLGTPPEEGGVFSAPDTPYRRRYLGLPSFVTVRGGAYFFLPGIRALRTLATLDR